MMIKATFECKYHLDLYSNDEIMLGFVVLQRQSVSRSVSFDGRTSRVFFCILLKNEKKSSIVLDGSVVSTEAL